MNQSYSQYLESDVVEKEDSVEKIFCQDFSKLKTEPLTQDLSKTLISLFFIEEDDPEIIGCPSCGRADIDVYKLAEEVERRALGMKKNIKIAVMGCVVNGPGESLEADIGIAGGRGEGLVYKKGKPIKKVPEKDMLEFLMNEIASM
jgi:(E)-4-hydroxy-3-methylbut-2-enyl-diphosphate synthase